MSQSQWKQEHSRPRAGVVVPLRSLSSGKLRLAGTLDPSERAALIQKMASTVIAAAGDLQVLVVHDDPEVAEWAEERGAMALAGIEPGLNNAVREGRQHLADLGFDTAIIAHADLPLARDLTVVAHHDQITIVPDRIDDGTNVLALPTKVDFRFAYGPGSFQLHQRVALATGLDVQVLRIPELACDVDHPDDLSHLEDLDATDRAQP